MKQCKYKQVILLLVLSLVVWNGCALNPGARQLVVRSEQAQEIALDTFDAFLKAERLWETKQTDPTEYRKSQLHQYAETVRKQGLSWINSVKNTTRLYKSSPTAETKQAATEAQANLSTQLNIVNTTLTAISTTGVK